MNNEPTSKDSEVELHDELGCTEYCPQHEKIDRVEQAVKQEQDRIMKALDRLDENAGYCESHYKAVAAAKAIVKDGDRG